MKIGLIDVDSHNFPNLCLMKLSAYHKAKGHTVEWWNAKGRYDLVYKSRVFTDTYSKDTITVTNAEQVIFGGTGYDTKNRLPPEVEHSYPDYSIYPQFFGIAYGFLSRGCPRNCGFCIVSSKEGRKSVKVADLSEFWKWQPEIKIMDANLLACPDHENLIEQLIRSRAWVDFSQGLDIRLVNRDNVSLLNRVRIKAVHFAWDNPDEDLTGYFQRFLDLTAIKSSRQRRVYVLTNYGSTHEQDLYRVNTLRAMGFDPYVMIYERPTAPPVTRHLQRWVNNKRLFYAVPRFEDYIPGRKEVCNGVCNRPKGLNKNQKQGNVQPYETTANLFQRGGSNRTAAVLFGKRQRWNNHSGIVHGACHAAYVFACHVREKRATAGSDYSAICGSEVSSPQRATLSDQQFLCRPCAARAIR